MPSTRLPPPLFGVVARTEAGRARLDPRALHPWVHRWRIAPSAEDWWIDAVAGVAIFRPERVARSPDGTAAVLAVRGTITTSQLPAERPLDWGGGPEPDATTALLYHLVAGAGANVDTLRGQFSLAVWDGRRRTLLLARDALGQRCVFVRTTAELTVFCSELAPLLGPPDGNCELDPEAAVWYLAFGMPPPGRTLAAGVDRLPAAHLLTWAPGRPPMVRRYWTPLSADAPRDATPETIERIRAGLDRAITSCMPADTPWGVLLSGGVDSSYLAAAAAACSPTTGHAFTSSFDALSEVDELPWARMVAARSGLRHEEVRLGPLEALELLDEVVLAAAEPCSAWAALTHFRILAQAQQRNVAFVLSGLGADEVFGGYDHFRGYFARYLRSLRRRPPPAGMNPFASLLLAEEQESRRALYPGVARFFDDRALDRGLEEPYRRWQYASHLRTFYRECLRLKPEAEVMEMMVAHECQHRIPDLLFAGFEPISRRLGIEVAYPFLDPDFVQLVCGLRAESRYRTPAGRFSLRLRDLDRRFKHAMFQVAEGRVPREVLERSRRSFTAPFGEWLFDSAFAGPLLRRLRQSRFWNRGVVRPAWLDEILPRVRPGPGPWVFQLWALVTLSAWYDRYVERPSPSWAAGRGWPADGAQEQPAQPGGSQPSDNGSR
jgi:asparagine synthase (glutamine-hydrolysing)